MTDPAFKSKKNNCSTRFFSIHVPSSLFLPNIVITCWRTRSQVVLAVGALYYYVAPKFERTKVGKSLVRILHCKSIEQNFIVLKSIVTMSATSPVRPTPIFNTIDTIWSFL